MTQSPPQWKQRFFSSKILISVLCILWIGSAVAAIATWRHARTQESLVRRRYDAMSDMLALYDLQVKYKSSRGHYANDLATLLTIAPQSESFKGRLAAHVDINTVTVVDQGAKFKIEINALDGDRTLMKIRGPLPATAR